MAQNKKPWIPDYTIKDAKIRWRNFAGREGMYNAKGDRNFAIFLEPEDSEALAAMGLNVKTLPPREEGQTPTDILKVKVKFNTARPPRIVLVTHKGRNQLDEETAQILDTAEIKKVDLILSPYHWDNNGKEGIAVSLKTLFMTIVEDELEMLYSDLPEASSSLNNMEYTPDFDEAETQAPRGPRFS